jgi:hypothetical protein
VSSILASPSFTGTPALPTGATAITQASGDSSTKIATTAFVATGLSTKTNKDYVDNLLTAKANLASPTFTGTPTLPSGTIATTQTAGDSTTAIATTLFVTRGLATKVNKTYVDNAITAKASLVSPVFTGTPSLPTGATAVTQSAGDSTTKIATTFFVTSGLSNKVNKAYVDNLLTAKAPLASPAFTGTPSLPTGATAVTQSAGDSTTALATTLFVTRGLATKVNKTYVDNALTAKAALASPTFTGTPTLPTGTIATTQSSGDSTTSIATTAFVAKAMKDPVNKVISPLAKSSDYTVTATEVLNAGIISVSSSSARTITLPSASALATALPAGSAVAGDIVTFLIVPTASSPTSSTIITITPGSGGTFISNGADKIYPVISASSFNYNSGSPSSSSISHTYRNAPPRLVTIRFTSGSAYTVY